MCVCVCVCVLLDGWVGVWMDGWITETFVMKGNIEMQDLNLFILLLVGCCALSVPGRSGLHYSIQEPR